MDLQNTIDKKVNEYGTLTEVFITINESQTDLIITLGKSAAHKTKVNDYNNLLYHISTELFDEFNTNYVEKHSHEILAQPLSDYIVGEDRYTIINELLASLNASKQVLEEYMYNRCFHKAYKDNNIIDNSRNQTLEFNKRLHEQLPELKEEIDYIIADFNIKYKITPVKVQKKHNTNKLLHDVGYNNDEINLLNKKHNQPIKKEIITPFETEIKNQLQQEPDYTFSIFKKEKTNTLAKQYKQQDHRSYKEN